MKTSKAALLKINLAFLSTFLFLNSAALSAENDWWPAKVVEIVNSEQKPFEYEPIQKVSNKWHICVLLPHMKDTSWVAANYGVVEHAKKLGLKVSVFEAGGYENLSRQISQFDDCVALGVDAIILSAISEAGLAQKIREAADKKIVQVALVNPIADAPVNAGVFNDYKYKASIAAKAAIELLSAGGNVTAIDLPGPAGSGWAESAASGFDTVVEGTNIAVLDTKFGDTGKVEQTQIIEDAFQTYDKIDLIFGNGVAAEAAPSVIRQMGLTGKVKVISWYSTEGVWNGIRNGTIEGTSDEELVVTGAIAVDIAARALEGQAYPTRILPPTFYANKESISTVNWGRVLAPENWRPVFNVD
jgi:protein TorT